MLYTFRLRQNRHSLTWLNKKARLKQKSEIGSQYSSHAIKYRGTGSLAQATSIQEPQNIWYKQHAIQPILHFHTCLSLTPGNFGD